MNVIYYYNLTAHNGWLWRFEIITSDTTLLSNPTYIEIPENAVTSEITWQAKFQNAPIGLTDTPSVTMSFNMANLASSPELLALRAKLDSPFLPFDVPIAATPPYSYEGYDPITGAYGTINVPGGTLATATVRLSNVLRVMTNFGNPNETDFNNLKGTEVNAQSTAMVFSGVQAVSPPSTYNHRTKTITVEFMHLNRYVLEQMNPSMVDSEISTLTSLPAASVIINGWKDPASSGHIELHETSGDEESYQSDNVRLYKVKDLFDTIGTLFTTIRKAIIRQDGFTFNGFAPYLTFAKFYKQNLDNGLQGGVLAYNELYFIGRVYSATTDGNAPETIGGMFAPSSKFYGFKNMFDFLVDVSECGTKAFYYEYAMFSQLLITTLELPPNDAELLTLENIELDDESERQYAALGGYESEVAGNNITVSNFGRAQVEDTFNFVPYFHNVFQDWSYSFAVPTSPPPPNSTILGFSTNITALEGQLFYEASGKVIAVHAACDFQNTALGYAQDVFAANFTIAPSAYSWLFQTGFIIIGSPYIPDEGFARIEEKMSSYYALWRSELGIARRIGYEIVSNLSSDRQRKFSGSCRLKAGRIVSGSPVTDISMPFPRNVGRRYTLDTGFFDAWLDIPASRVFLISSELDIVKGLSKNDFFAQDIPITITPI